MKKSYYTDERGTQIVIALLKAHGIRKVVASPGATNITFVGSIQGDPYFEIYSSVDERSAAYIACGMAAESGEPVVLSCTGATASRNYMPGLTEAYYRKLPVLAITSTQGNHRLGNLIPQNIDRRVVPNDIAKLSVYVPSINTQIEEKEAMLNVNRAMLELRHHGGGPVHINLATTYSKDFSAKELPEVQIINRIMHHDTFPELKGRIAVLIGSHAPFTDEETEAVDAFCATYDAIAICDHTSGYKGKYRAMMALLNSQKWEHELLLWDIVIHIGEVSGDYHGGVKHTKQAWRVSEDGELRDTLGSLRYVFEMREIDFFRHYAKEGATQDSKIQTYHRLYQDIYNKVEDLPFGNLWMAKELAPKLPENSVLHIGILNSLRSWNFFETPRSVQGFCNVGGFGIDGNCSSLIGASLVSPNKLFFGIIGDLAFFYDLNSIGNRHVGNNIRIMLVNNGMGAEFRNYNHPWGEFGDEANPYGAAAGHFGNKSQQLVRHYAEDLGYEYLTASCKEDFTAHVDRFLTPSITDKPMIFEVFTDHQDESDALFMLNHTVTDVKNEAKELVKKVVGDKGVQVIKKILK